MIRFPVYNFIVYWTFPVPFQLMVGLSTGRIVNIFHEQYWIDSYYNILTLVYTINYYDGALRDFASLIFEAILEYLTVIQKFLIFAKQSKVFYCNASVIYRMYFFSSQNEDIFFFQGKNSKMIECQWE